MKKTLSEALLDCHYDPGECPEWARKEFGRLLWKLTENGRFIWSREELDQRWFE